MNREKIRFGKIFIFSVLGVFAFFIFLVLILPKFERESAVPKEALILTFLGISFVTFLISKTKFDFLQMYRIMTFAVAGLVFYFSLYVHHISSVIFLMYIPVVLMILMFINLKSAIISAAFFLLTTVFVSEISSFFNISHSPVDYVRDAELIKMQDYVIMFSTIYFSFLTLYFHNLFVKIQAKHASNQVEIDVPATANDRHSMHVSEKSELSPERANLLYAEIITYFEKERPFTNASFSIAMLAKELDTNATYIYKALNAVSQKSFRDLVNEYRIAQVLSEIEREAHKKFTIEHIYMEAGFVQQSTFNRVFKKITGQTPSQYIENQPNK